MPNEVVIKVENLSKLYRLGELHKQTNSFREKITQSFGRLINPQKFKKSNPTPYALSPTPSSPDDSIWALKDISFEVKRGEVLGIIGRNGAGKSTLLKILSRITKPTEGKAWINGRVGSLLEVGTGFHAELTGRENIYLNGAILGMTKAEIKRKFDEIVDFAEIEKFIDTPVKRYSSGMYVRLAFAVAAHLEPEILLVDEVLAVGDLIFQKKCIVRMANISAAGRTILFVSHNTSAVGRLCTQAIMLSEGQIAAVGKTHEVIETYLSDGRASSTFSLKNRNDRKGNGKAIIVKVDFLSINGGNYIASGNDMGLVVTVKSSVLVYNPVIYLGIFDETGLELVHITSLMTGNGLKRFNGERTFCCKIKRLPLSPGKYRIDAAILDGYEMLDHVMNIGLLHVSQGDFFGTGYMGPAIKGRLLLNHTWGVL